MATFTSASYEGRYLQLTITETVNVAANTSTLSWTLPQVLTMSNTPCWSRNSSKKLFASGVRRNAFQ